MWSEVSQNGIYSIFGLKLFLGRAPLCVTASFWDFNFFRLFCVWPLSCLSDRGICVHYLDLLVFVLDTFDVRSGVHSSCRDEASGTAGCREGSVHCGEGEEC